MKQTSKKSKGSKNEKSVEYWLSQSPEERLTELRRIREKVILEEYGYIPEFQRVYRIVKLADKNKSYEEIPAIKIEECGDKKGAKNE